MMISMIPVLTTGKKLPISFLKRVVLTFIVFFLPLYAEVPDDAIRKSVVHYNLGVIEAAKTGKVHKLAPYANEEVLRKLFIWIMSWQENSLYMQAKLERIDFKKIESGEKNAKVRTAEMWTYRYYDAKNKKIAWPVTRVNYETEYLLFMHKGRWIIEKVTVLSEKQTPLENNPPIK